jgi:hypothetical protein
LSPIPRDFIIIVPRAASVPVGYVRLEDTAEPHARLPLVTVTVKDKVITIVSPGFATAVSSTVLLTHARSVDPEEACIVRVIFGDAAGGA